MFIPALLLLLPITTPVLVQASDPEHIKSICSTGGKLVDLPSGNKIRYLCDDCLIDKDAKLQSPGTIEECADFCNGKNCKGTMWDNGNCFSSKLTYTGSSSPESPGCIWMTAQTCYDGGDDCSTCLDDKKDCIEKKRECEDRLASCQSGDKECEDKARKCKDDLTSCEGAKKRCEKKERDCSNDLTSCEDDMKKCQKRERECSNDLHACEEDKNVCAKKERKCQSELQDSQKENSRIQGLLDECTDDLDKCKKSGSSWGNIDGEIKCKSGSLTTATLNGNKWYTLCGFIINEVKGAERGLTLKECVQTCSEDRKCKAITYDKERGDCYKAHKFKTGDMRYSNYYDTVLRLT